MSVTVNLYTADTPAGIQLHPEATATYAKRRLERMDWGAAPITRKTRPLPWGYGEEEELVVISGSRVVTFQLLSRCGTEAKAWDEYEELRSELRTSQAAMTLRRRFDTGSATIDRMLKVRSLLSGGMSWLVDGRPRFVGRESMGVIRTPIILETIDMPLFRLYTPSAATAVAIGGGATTVNNPGQWPVGAKLVTASLVGSYTQLVISNATTGPKSESGGGITWNNASNFSNGDTIDWRYTDHKVVDVQNGTLGNWGGDFIVLWPGDNSITITGTGGTSGNVNISVDPLYE